MSDIPSTVSVQDVVPIIDIEPFLKGNEPDRNVVAKQVAEACERIGFFFILGHGVSNAFREEMYEVTGRFYDLPLDSKMQTKAPSPMIFRGYYPMKSRAAGRTRDRDKAAQADLREAFTVGRFESRKDAYDAGYRDDLGPELYEQVFYPNIWPRDLPEMRPVVQGYYKSMEALAITLQHIFARALGLPDEWFDDKFNHHCTTMTLNHYPPQEEAPKPGELRIGAHSDWDAFTVLYQDETSGGLQVPPKPDSKEWLDVPIVPGAFLINIGDVMERWTNDRWVSTLHRVVNPPREFALTRRISIPFFYTTNIDAMVQAVPTCIDDMHPSKYPPITNLELRSQQFMKTNLEAQGYRK